MIYKYARLARENKEMVMISFTIITTWVLIFMTAVSLTLKTHFVKESDYTSSESTKEALCNQVMRSILKREVHPHMVSSEILKALTDSKYKALDLNSHEELKYVFSSDKGCKVIIQDQKGLRAFELGLNESYLNTFYYKVVQISERDIQEKL